MLSRHRRAQALVALTMSVLGTIAAVVPALAGGQPGPWPH